MGLIRPRQARQSSNGGRPRGFTLVEVMVAIMTLLVALIALFGAIVGQATLNEHARNLTWAINDANRVMERLRQLNTGCTTPSVAVPSECETDGDGDNNDPCASWDAWLNGPVAGGKSIQPNELVVLTTTGANPLPITVAICWRHRGRTLGECSWSGVQLSPNDADGDGLIESPAMLSTLMTCRRQ